MQVISAKFVTKFLEIYNFKNQVEKSFLSPKRTNRLHISNHLRKNYLVNEFQVMQKTVVTIQPKEKTQNIHVLFFHGGAYLLEGNSMHWKIVETIVQKSNAKVSYIDYPLAPEYNYKTTFEMVQKSFEILVNQYPDDRFMFMGDSAGGGLALAFAQKLKNENAAIQPMKNILFSPWLDLTMRNPDIKQQEHLDKILPLSGLIDAAKKYAAGDDLNHYLLSPINGELEGLGSTMVFYGTHELFYPDCKKLKDKSKNYGNFIFHEFAEMQHDWVVFPIPEAKQAIEIAIDFIKESETL